MPLRLRLLATALLCAAWSAPAAAFHGCALEHLYLENARTAPPRYRLLFGQYAEKVGMLQTHAARLKKYAQDNALVIVVRRPKTETVKYVGKPGYRPKPVEVKLKTAASGGPHAGLVVRPEHPTAAEQKNIAELEASGWHFDEQGLLRDQSGNAVHSDYDLQMVSERRREGDATYWVRVDTNRPDFIAGINDAVADDGGRVFMHGANDDYRAAILNTDIDPSPARTPDPDEQFLVFDSNGSIYEAPDLASLQGFYLRRQILWPYQ